MANNCWNWVQINDPKETLDIIEERFKKYNDWEGTFTEFSRMILGLDPEIVPENETNEQLFSRIYTYGTKWWDLNINRGDGWLELCGDSAWSPPLYLLARISEVFNVKVEAEYEECGMDFAGFFTAEKGQYEDRQMTCFEYELENDRNSAVERLIEHINEDWFDFKYAEDNYKQHLTEEEWNQVITETNKL